MTKIIPILVVFLIIGILIFAAFIYPVWLLVYCAISKSKSTKSKVVWIIFMLLIWPMASFVYGLFSAKKKLFQWISGILILGLLASGTVLFYAMHLLGERASAEFTKDISKIDRMDTTDITPQELTKLKESLSVLKDEMKFSLSGLDKMHKGSSLMDLFDIIDKDNKITISEYKDWMGKFEARKMLDREALAQCIRDLKARPN